MAGDRGDRLKWLKTLFHVQGLGWQLPSVVGGVVVAAGVVWLWLREPAQDFLTANVMVWQLLLTVGAAGCAVAFVAGWIRRQSEGPECSIWTGCPSEIRYFDVLWPITTVSDGLKPTMFEVGEPMCPKCRSTLGYIPGDVFGKASSPAPLHSLWMNIDAHDLLLECFKDGTQYDLRGPGQEMEDLVAIVENLAWGEYRTAQEAAAKKPKR